MTFAGIVIGTAAIAYGTASDSAALMMFGFYLVLVMLAFNTWRPRESGWDGHGPLPLTDHQPPRELLEQVEWDWLRDVHGAAS